MLLCDTGVLLAAGNMKDHRHAACLAMMRVAERKEFVRTVFAAGFPAPETMEEFRSLVAAPLLHGPPPPHPDAHATRTRRTRPKRPRQH